MRLLDRAQSRIPQRWRAVVDWLVTIAVAVVFVLAFQAEVAKPYRIPSSSMEPTLHCAKPGDWCLGSRDDRVIANRLAYRFGSPRRGQIVVFTAPPAASTCEAGGGGSAFVKRLIGLPGERVVERRGYLYINGRRLAEPYINPAFRGTESGAWPLLARRTISSSETTALIRAIPAIGAPCRARTSSGQCCSPTGRRPGSRCTRSPPARVCGNVA